MIMSRLKLSVIFDGFVRSLSLFPFVTINSARVDMHYLAPLLSSFFSISSVRFIDLFLSESRSRAYEQKNPLAKDRHEQNPM